jgi:hypothetical protein
MHATVADAKTRKATRKRPNADHPVAKKSRPPAVAAQEEETKQRRLSNNFSSSHPRKKPLFQPEKWFFCAFEDLDLAIQG